MSVRLINRNLVITIDPASTNLGYKTFLNGTLVLKYYARHEPGRHRHHRLCRY